MPSSPFLKPRLVGGRFESHDIPLEFLRDWAVFEELVLEVAKWRFFEANPGRQRSPRGFFQGVSLRLSTVEEGSAIPVIVLSIASSVAPMLFGSDVQGYLEESREAIVSAINAAELNKSAADHLPENCLGYFQVFGRSLRDGEAIEFDTGTNSARLTTESRRRLLAAAKDAIVTDRMVIVGTIPEADQEKGTFNIQLADESRFPCKELVRHQKEILEAFNGYKAGVRVRLRGVARYTAGGEFQGVDEVTSASIVDPLDVLSRIEELGQLKDGWFDGQGKAPPPNGLSWFAGVFDDTYSERLALPHVYPTVAGGLRGEWSVGSREISLEVDLKGRTGEWHELDVNTDEENGRSLSLDLPAHWKWMMERLGELGALRND